MCQSPRVVRTILPLPEDLSIHPKVSLVIVLAALLPSFRWDPDPVPKSRDRKE